MPQKRSFWPPFRNQSAFAENQNPNDSADNTPDPLEDKGLNVLVKVMAGGAVVVLAAAIYAWYTCHTSSALFSVLGLSCAICLVSAAVGGLLGFLFGIPISKQATPGAEASTPAAPQSPNQPVLKPRNDTYANNTNLEQISDWLTKIIVGVSLTQLPKIQDRFNSLVTTLSAGLGDFIGEKFARPYAGSMVIFYAICGFLFVYLWAKIYLKDQLVRTDNSEIIKAVKAELPAALPAAVNALLPAAVTKEVTSQVKTKDNRVDIDRVQQKIEQFNRQRARILFEEEKPEYRAMIEKAKPGPVNVFNDVQKSRWGGTPTANGFAINPAFELSEKETTDKYYNVTVSVTSENAEKPLTGPVYFFLHDTFNTKIIQKVEAQGNSASVKFGSYEAFTIGAYIDQADTKLELDLNTAPNAPEDYKYTDSLLTIEELRQQLDKLKQEA